MGTTVGTILISYDVDNLNPEVKSALEDLGYEEEWKYNGRPRTFEMPNTTLWHPNKSSDQGMTDMQRVCADLRITLRKAISVLADEFVGI